MGDRLLIDCGPEIPAAASRHAADLSQVTTLLFTHAHPDHVGPAALLFRHWAGRDEPLDVFAPVTVLHQLKHWIAPSDPVHLNPLEVGDSVSSSGFTIAALAAEHGDVTTGTALLYDVREEEPGGRRLFYATDTGPLPQHTLDAVADARFDVVLLEETFGDQLTHDTDHLDLATFPEQLRRLRAVGAVTDATDVVAVHLSHHNPSTPLLQRRLSSWGARVVPDGAILGQHAPPGPTLPQRTLVLGGARSGKSRHAEALLAASDHVTYIATAPEHESDGEWQQRIQAHRARRPKHWATIETHDLARVLDEAGPADHLLIDCLTLWLTQVMDDTGAWQGELTDVAKRIDELLVAWRQTRATVVAVSNEVGQGVVPATSSGRLFRDTHGRLNATLAAASDEVTYMVAGRPVAL